MRVRLLPCPWFLWSFVAIGIAMAPPTLQAQELRLRKSLEGHPGIIRSVAFSHDGKFVASGGGTFVTLWNTGSGANAAQWRAHEFAIFTLAFSPDDNYLAVGIGAKMPKVWDIGKQVEVTKLEEIQNSASMSLAFSRDGKVLASASRRRAVVLWDAKTGKVIATFEGLVLKKPETGTNAGIYSVVFSPDGKTLAAGSAKKMIRLFDLTTLRETASWSDEHKHGGYSMAISPDGKTLATGASDQFLKGGFNVTDGDIHLWDVQTKKKTAVLKGHASTVYGLAFSPDGKTLASCSSDKTVRLWDVATNNPIATLREHTDAVYCIAYSPNGKTLASGGKDKTIKLWDVQPAK
ncbi:MAG: WD40 repeat domain-containing protein [Planctomycetes bacterium]|nr:WD40 repeat domain-containing protein [Planctomycetota bacterium]